MEPRVRVTVLSVLLVASPIAGCLDLDGPPGPGEDPPGITAQQALDRLYEGHARWERADLVWLTGEESAEQPVDARGPIGDGELARWEIALWNTTSDDLLVADVSANGTLRASTNRVEPGKMTLRGQPDLGTFAVDSDQAARVLAEHDRTRERFPENATYARYTLIKAGPSQQASTAWIAQVQSNATGVRGQVDALNGELSGPGHAPPRPSEAQQALGTLTLEQALTRERPNASHDLRTAPGQASARLFVIWPVTQWPDGVEPTLQLEAPNGTHHGWREGPGWRSTVLRATGGDDLRVNLTVSLAGPTSPGDDRLRYWVQLGANPSRGQIAGDDPSSRTLTRTLPEDGDPARHTVEVTPSAQHLFAEVAWDPEAGAREAPTLTLTADNRTHAPSWALTGEGAGRASWTSLDPGTYTLTVGPGELEAPADRYHLRIVQAPG